MTRFGALALVALTLTLPACGGEDDDAGGGTGGAPPTTEEEARTATVETDTPAEADGEEGEPERDDDDGGGGGERSQPEAPSRAEYIQSADRICREAQSAIARRSAEYRKVGAALARRKIKAEEYYRRGGELTELSGEIAERAVADLKELEAPKSRREAVEAYLEGATTHSAILTAQGKALRQGRIKEVAKLNRRAAQVGRETRRAARRVGFRVCGGGS